MARHADFESFDPGKRDERYRSNGIGNALDVLVFIRTRRASFTIADLAREMEWHTRTAQRWLESCEARGLIDIDRVVGPRPWRCRVTPYGRSC